MSNEIIRLELERAEESLKSATMLIAGDCNRDAMSRLYYAVLHFARALLTTKNISPKSHQGALQLFSLHFVKTGLVPLEAGRILARQQKFREESDYNVEFLLDRESVEKELVDARKFREICLDFLQRTTESPWCGHSRSESPDP